ncbi:hypothetical protein EDB81DRAFT_257985 [Dactylonectria macrodidyma]|uniref:Uncharacterized protein n=1 Tax=Dactylonectria macrodidyma TaxID=307937 RepID=A0A9P9JJV2_9HYPO|nr:hypothetical protein EDB81DRAFT_257985 [Dactylonectria macrodidyma]
MSAWASILWTFVRLLIRDSRRWQAGFYCPSVAPEGRRISRPNLIGRAELKAKPQECSISESKPRVRLKQIPVFQANCGEVEASRLFSALISVASFPHQRVIGKNNSKPGIANPGTSSNMNPVQWTNYASVNKRKNLLPQSSYLVVKLATSQARVIVSG